MAAKVGVRSWGLKRTTAAKYSGSCSVIVSNCLVACLNYGKTGPTLIITASLHQRLFKLLFDFIEGLDRLLLRLMGRAKINGVGGSLIAVIISHDTLQSTAQTESYTIIATESETRYGTFGARLL